MFQGVPENRAAQANHVHSRLEIVAAAILVATSILIHRVNHDEGQYVAAIALMRAGWPYLDFPYLQTPLQPLVYSPLALADAGWLLVAVRVLNGLLAVATVAITGSVLIGKVRPGSRLIALAALCCSEAFLLAGSLARNDALPMVLLAGAIALMLSAIERIGEWRLFALAGCLFGLAASAKINAAIPGAGAAVFVLWRRRLVGFPSATAFFAGGLAGLFPSIVFAALAPDQFGFDVFTYGLKAPVQWWMSVGKTSSLSWRGIPNLLGLASQGVVLVGLIAAVADRTHKNASRLLDFMIVGGIIAAYLTQPPFPQYLVPLLPPVTIRFALALDRFERPVIRRLIIGATLLSCAAGLADTAHYVLRIRKHGLELVEAVRLGNDVALLTKHRSIATLSPERVAGANTSLDPRFATGPFLFRTSDRLAEQALRYGHSPNWQHIDAALDLQRPGAVLVGGELKPQLPLHPAGLDAPLIGWAKAHDYKPVSLAHGFTLFVQP